MFDYTYRYNYTLNVSGGRSISAYERRINFNLSGNYNFSDMVSGALKIEYTHYRDWKVENTSSTSYGGRFDVKIKF